MATKLCRACGETKESDQFYRNKTRKGGLSHWCKACFREWDRTDVGRIAHRKRCRKYSLTEKGKESARRNAAIARKRFPDKTKARHAVKRIPTMPCKYPDCRHSESRLERHHWDYSKPMEVVSFCKRHHALADKVRMIIDSNKLCYAE